MMREAAWLATGIVGLALAAFGCTSDVQQVAVVEPSPAALVPSPAPSPMPTNPPPLPSTASVTPTPPTLVTTPTTSDEDVQQPTPGEVPEPAGDDETPSTAPATAAVVTGAPEVGTTLCVVDIVAPDTLNLRSAPSVGAPILAELGPDQCGLQVVSVGADWIEVHLSADGSTGYASARFLGDATNSSNADWPSDSAWGPEPAIRLSIWQLAGSAPAASDRVITVRFEPSDYLAGFAFDVFDSDNNRLGDVGDVYRFRLGELPEITLIPAGEVDPYCVPIFTPITSAVELRFQTRLGLCT